MATEMMLTLADVARLLRVGRTKAGELCRPGGEIEAIRVGRQVRVPWSAFNDYLERQKTVSGRP